MPHAWGYASDKRTRDENQDSYGLFEVPMGLLAVVCDGMGGHLGGAIASAIAVKAIHDHMNSAVSSPADALKTALEQANTAVYDRARRSRKLMGMGTTAVAALITDDASTWPMWAIAGPTSPVGVRPRASPATTPW